MKNQLNIVLKNLLDWDIRRINFLINFIEALIKQRTVNLAEISKTMESKAKPESVYRNIQRFLNFEINLVITAQIMMSLIKDKYVTLVIDRTNWSFGNFEINFFFLGVEYHGFAIPLFFHLLPKKGNSNQYERINLISEFIKVFGKDRIGILLADREFIGEVWFQWLCEEEIPFMIRTKDNLLINNLRGSKSKVRNYFREYKAKEVVRDLFGYELRLLGTRINTKEYFIVITNVSDACLDLYADRWSIENMFAAFKSKGFNLESTKLTDHVKLQKLVVLVSLAFIWCISVGKVFHDKKSRFRKDLGYYSKSIFKVGLDYISNALFNPNFKQKEMETSIKIFIRLLLGFKNYVVE